MCVYNFAYKGLPRNDLYRAYCVGRDVKPYSLTQYILRLAVYGQTFYTYRCKNLHFVLQEFLEEDDFYPVMKNPMERRSTKF